jgi:hypothetical protein
MNTSTNLIIELGLIEHLIHDSMETDPKEDVSFLNFIHHAANLHVNTTPECIQVLSRYYSTFKKKIVIDISRSYEHSCISLENLIKLAEAHARLCLRETVLVDDAMISIMFAEETLAFLSGSSLLGFQSLPFDQENIRLLFEEACLDNESDHLSSTSYDESHYDRFMRFFEYFNRTCP